MSEDTDLIRECADAGIIFHPKGGKLRPELTQGPIAAGLKRRVETSKELLLMFFVQAFDWRNLEASDIVSEFDGEVGVVDVGLVDENGMQGRLGRRGAPPV
jgi:hypothetical protein